MKNPLLISFILFTCLSYSQSKSIKFTGKIVSINDSIPLESATIYLERIKDSSVINYTISNKNGLFTLEDKIYDLKINFVVSYVGYRTFSKTIDLKTSEIDLKTIFLEQHENLLNEVEIRSRAPITVKKDTLEFNVKSFNTKKDANVEDLLRKLPGVEIGMDGEIKINGKVVNEILVNGKPFFSNDPLIATRNLSKDIIEKIQVTDTKSKSEVFLGQEGDRLNKSINLVVKEENNKGIFGSLSAGKGSDDRYEVSGMLNLFNNDQRLSIVAGGNNVNSPRFSMGGFSSMTIGVASSVNFSQVSAGSLVQGMPSFGASNGITTSKNGGINYSDNFGKKVDFTTDYFYSTSNTEGATKTKRENILPDSRYFSNSDNSSINEKNKHRINFSTQFKIDSTLMIYFKPTIEYTKSFSEASSNEESLNDNQELINKSTNNNFSETTSKSFNYNLSISKKLNNKGRFIRLGINSNNNNQDSESFYDSNTELFGDTPSVIERNQQISSKNSSNNTKIDFTYRQPIIANKFFINFEYAFNNQKQTNEKYSYEFDENTQDFTEFSEDLSSDFTYTSINNSTGVSLNLQKEKISAHIGSSINFRTLKNSDFLRPELDLERKFTSASLNSNIRFNSNRTSTFSLGYNLTNSPPSLSYLQPFKNISNPLNTIIGNPSLEPSNNHQINLAFYNFNMQKKSNFNANIGARFINDNIVSKSVIDENYLRTTSYTNVDGNRNLYGNTNYSKSIKVDSVKTVRFNIGLGLNSSRNVNYSNDEKYISNNNSLSPSLGLTFNWQNAMEINPKYSISFSKSSYDIDLFEDRTYTQHSFSVRTRSSIPKNFEWQNNLNYNYNPNIAEGFKKSSWNWNATLAYKFAGDKFVSTLKVYDILNQNTNARRTATENYIQDSESTILKRYFMFSLKWNFNNRSKPRQRGGNFMMMH